MPESRSQVRLAHAVLEGHAKSSMPAKVAQEIVSKMHGKRMSALPEKKKARKFKL